MLVMLVAVRCGTRVSVNALSCIVTSTREATRAEVGPWVLENVDPTANLIIPGVDAKAEAVVALLGAATCQLVGERGMVAAWKVAMEGMPLCYAMVGEGQDEAGRGSRAMVADAAGTLWLLHLGRKWVVRIHPSSPCSPPRALTLLSGRPASAGGSAAVRAVFLASRSGPSQLLGMPEFPEKAAAGQATVEVLDPNLIDSFAAPVRAAQLVPVLRSVEPRVQAAAAGAADCSCCGLRGEEQEQHASRSGGVGEEECMVMMCCGAAPRGRLLCAGFGLPFRQFAHDSTDLPAGTLLLPAQGCLNGSWRSLLVFTLQETTSREVMEVMGSEMRLLDMPGLDTGSSTLLLHIAPRDMLLQASSSGVRALDGSAGFQLRSSWAPGREQALQLAAAVDDHLAVACFSEITLLQCAVASSSSSSGGGGGGSNAVGYALAELRSWQMPHQVSALALFAGGDEAAPALTAAVGQWERNTVELVSCDNPAYRSEMTLPAAAQPRSLCVLSHPGMPQVLLVGTSGGDVVYCPLQRERSGSAEPGRPRLRLGGARVVTVGTAAVHLQLLPPAGAAAGQGAAAGRTPAVLAHSDRDALFGYSAPQLLRGAAVSAEWDALKAFRIVGTPRTLAIAAAALPTGQQVLAAVTRDQQLVVGELGQSPQLCRTTLELPDTPTAMAFLRSAQCCAAACRTAGGQAVLRLVHALEMVVVAELELERGHYPTALAALELPCVPAGAAVPARRAPADGPGRSAAALAGGDSAGFPLREVLVVASYAICSAEQHAPAEVAQGMLSFFQVQVVPSADRRRMQYRMCLLGVHLLPGSTCSCLSTVRPALRQQDAAEGSGRPGPRPPLADGGRRDGSAPASAPPPPALPERMLVAGTDRGVLLIEVLLDPHCRLAEAAVTAALSSLQSGPAAAAPGPGSAGTAAQAAAAAASEPVQRAAMLVHCCAMPHGQPCVSELSSYGSSVAALSFLASATVFEAVAEVQGDGCVEVRLVPRSADLGPDFCQSVLLMPPAGAAGAGAESAAHAAGEPSAAEPASILQPPQDVLVAPHAGGVLLLQRWMEAEVAFRQQAEGVEAGAEAMPDASPFEAEQAFQRTLGVSRQQFLQQMNAGIADARHPAMVYDERVQEVHSDEPVLPPPTPSVLDLPALQLQAHCPLPDSVCAAFSGRLGLHSRPWPPCDAASPACGSLPCPPQQLAPLLLLTTSGCVGSLLALPEPMAKAVGTPPPVSSLPEDDSGPSTRLLRQLQVLRPLQEQPASIPDPPSRVEQAASREAMDVDRPPPPSAPSAPGSLPVSVFDRRFLLPPPAASDPPDPAPPGAAGNAAQTFALAWLRHHAT